MSFFAFSSLGGYPPFSDQLKKPLKEQILEGSYSFHEKFWSPVSREAKDLISKLLTVDPKERISVTNALEHPWMQVRNTKLRAKCR